MSWLDKNEGGVFGGFWIVFVVGSSLRIAEKHFPIDDPQISGPQIEQLVLFVGCILAGIIIWKILKRERLTPIRNIIVALQGLVLFPFILLFLIMVPLLLIMAAAHLIGGSFLGALMEALSCITFPLVILAGLFVSGCFVGLRIRRLAPFWCVLAAVGIYFLGANYPGTATAAVIITAFALAVFGSHLGRRYATETASEIPNGGNSEAPVGE